MLQYFTLIPLSSFILESTLGISQIYSALLVCYGTYLLKMFNMSLWHYLFTFLNATSNCHINRLNRIDTSQRFSHKSVTLEHSHVWIWQPIPSSYSCHFLFCDEEGGRRDTTKMVMPRTKTTTTAIKMKSAVSHYHTHQQQRTIANNLKK